jgi:hypothetical protein
MIEKVPAVASMVSAADHHPRGSETWVVEDSVALLAAAVAGRFVFTASATGEPIRATILADECLLG